MARSALHIILFLLTPLFLSSQTNLIPNPNFDKKKPGVDCSYQYSRGVLEDFIENWHAYYTSGNILFESCVGITYTGIRTTPVKGDGVLLNFYDTSPVSGGGEGHRTYFQVKLIERLEPGKNYFLEYYFQTRQLSFPTAYHGIHFTDTLEVNGSRGIPFRWLEIDSPHLELDTVPHDHVIGEWQAIQHCFTVDKEYSVLIGGILRPRTFIFPFRPEEHFSHTALFFYDAFYLIEVEDSLYLNIEERVDTICVGDCITLSTNHSRIPGTFRWELPGSNLGQSADSVVRVCYNEPGLYDVGFVVEHCYGLFEEEWIDRIVVLDRPDTEDRKDLQHQLLLGESLELPACAEGDWEFIWDDHELLSCTDCPNPTYSGFENAELSVIVAPDSPCPDTCIHKIEILSPVTASFSTGTTVLCEGDCFTITNHSTHYGQPIEYWLNGLHKFWPVNESTLSFCPDNAGEYELILVAQNELSADSATVRFTVVPYPENVFAETDHSLAYGEEIMLNPGLIGQHYFWEANPPEHIDISCPDCSQTLITGLQSAQISLTVNNENCTDQMHYQIEVEKQAPQIYIPNSFSPNADGINDLFKPEGQHFTIRSIRIFDRYGGTLYEEFGSSASWDGTSKGQKLGVGTYVYTLEYEDIYGEIYTASGEVLLLR